MRNGKVNLQKKNCRPTFYFYQIEEIAKQNSGKKNIEHNSGYSQVNSCQVTKIFFLNVESNF